jgi:hypothetical protein
MPHMHLRGKDFDYRAEYPDGRKETILSVPNYDFNLQTQYRLAEPLLTQGNQDPLHRLFRQFGRQFRQSRPEG